MLPLQNASEYSKGQVETVSTAPPAAVTPQAAESCVELLRRNSSQKSSLVGSIVGKELGAAVGRATGAFDGANVGEKVGTGLGELVGARVGTTVGSAVGLIVGGYVTRLTLPIAVTTALPSHCVFPMQPSRMRNVCRAVPRGTVY